VEYGKVDSALRSDSRGASLAADAGANVDGGTQIVELSDNFQRRDRVRRQLVVYLLRFVELLAELLHQKRRRSNITPQRQRDRGQLVVFLVRFVELLAQLLHRKPRRTDFAQQRQRDRAVGLDDQFAVQVLVGERLDLNDVAAVQAIRVGLNVAGQAIDAFELI